MVDGVNGNNQPIIKLKSGTSINEIDLNQLKGLRKNEGNAPLFEKKIDTNNDGIIDDKDTSLDIDGDGVINTDAEIALYQQTLKELGGKDNKISEKDLKNVGITDKAGQKEFFGALVEFAYDQDSVVNYDPEYDDNYPFDPQDQVQYNEFMENNWQEGAVFEDEFGDKYTMITKEDGTRVYQKGAFEYNINPDGTVMDPDTQGNWIEGSTVLVDSKTYIRTSIEDPNATTFRDIYVEVLKDKQGNYYEIDLKTGMPYVPTEGVLIEKGLVAPPPPPVAEVETLEPNTMLNNTGDVTNPPKLEWVDGEEGPDGLVKATSEEGNPIYTKGAFVYPVDPETGEIIAEVDPDTGEYIPEWEDYSEVTIKDENGDEITYTRETIVDDEGYIEEVLVDSDGVEWYVDDDGMPVVTYEQYLNSLENGGDGYFYDSSGKLVGPDIED